MPEKSARLPLQDVLEAIGDIEEFVEGMVFETFASDKKTKNAVIRSLEIIGEAIKSIPEAIRVQHAEIEWKGWAGMRDKLIHRYFGVEWEIV